MWGYHKNSVEKNIIIFSKAKWFKSDVLIPPIYEKQVSFTLFIYVHISSLFFIVFNKYISCVIFKS
jgi:hypothetical protein